MAEDGERELWDGLLVGDDAAMRRLVDRKLPRVFALAYRILGDRGDAEDVAQETLVRAWRRPPEQRPGTPSLDAWMHRVALNLCYDRLRRRREVLVDEPPEVADERAGPEREVQSLTIADRLQAALMALPLRQREAIVLCHYQGLTNIRAAESMDISVEALESLLARARRSMRTALADLMD